MRGFIIYNELVFRRTSSVNTSLYVDSAKFCFLTYFITLETFFCLFVEQYFIRRIVKYFCCTSNTVLFEY